MVPTIPKPKVYPFEQVSQTEQQVEDDDEDIYFRITKSRYQGTADITTGYTLLPKDFIPNPTKTQTWVRSTPDFIYIDTIIPPQCSDQECLKQIYEFQKHQRMLKKREEMESKLMMTRKEWQEWQGFSEQEVMEAIEEDTIREEDYHRELIHDSRRFTFSGQMHYEKAKATEEKIEIGDLCGCLARREKREAELEWRERWERNRRLKELEMERCGCEKRAREVSKLQENEDCGCRARALQSSSSTSTPSKRHSKPFKSSSTTPKLPARRSSIKQSRKDVREEIQEALKPAQPLPNSRPTFIPIDKPSISRDALVSPTDSIASFVSAVSDLDRGRGSGETLRENDRTPKVEMVGVAI